MMLVTFNCYMTGASSGTGTDYASRATEFTPVRFDQSIVFCVVYGRSLFVLFFLLAIV